MRGWLAPLALALATHACAAPAPTGPGEIRIGMVNAQTGPASALGEGMLAGAQAVFREVNAAGGVHGRKLVLKVADDAYEPDQTVEQTLRLVRDEQVLALFGYVGTPTVNAVLPLLAELNVPLVGVFSGAQSLRRPLLPQVFNVRASYDDETEALVDRLLADGAKKIAVVYQNDGFGISVLSGTERALRKRGAAVSATGSFQRNTVAIRMALATMVEAEPDAIVMAGPYAPVAAFVKQARALKLRSRFATVSFVGAESLLARLDGEGQDMLISQVVPFPDEQAPGVARQCADALRQHGDEPLRFVNFEGCISARVLVKALQAAGPAATSQSLWASLEALGQFDLGGLPMAFSAQQHQASSQVFLTRIWDGRITPVR